DAFVARIDPDGTPRWARTIGDAGAFTFGGQVALDPHGDVVVVAGAFGPLAVVELDPEGNTLLDARVGSVQGNTSYAPVQSMAVDANGALLVTGTYADVCELGGLNIGGGPGLSGGNFAAKLSGKDGTAIWATVVSPGDPEVLEAG